MNMAYNLHRLGHEPVPMVYVGEDFAPDYKRHLTNLGINREAIVQVSGSGCARGLILTDVEGTQFTAFYPGPTGLDRHQRDLDLRSAEHFDALIIAPDLPEKMRACARSIAAPRLRVWCPGQYAEMLRASDIMEILLGVDTLIANRHEWEALCRQLPGPEIAGQLAEVVITDGAHPVTAPHQQLEVRVPEAAVSDPTGCGDAFAAAFVAAKLEGRSLKHAIEAGIQLASVCLGRHGSQLH
jgi:adenosine kinase